MLWETARPESTESMENLILYRDTAPAHRAEDPQLVLQIQFGVEIVSHPPYAQELSPCDFAC